VRAPGVLIGQDDVDVEARDRDAMTPILFAAFHGHVAVGNMLLARRRVDSKAVNLGRMGGMHVTAWKGHVRILSPLLSLRADPNAAAPLHYAAEYGHVAAARWLHTKAHANANVRNRIGATPLHLAAQSGRLDVVKELVSWGEIGLNARNGAGVPLEVR
jgi:ankyrin repeat protein